VKNRVGDEICTYSQGNYSFVYNVNCASQLNCRIARGESYSLCLRLRRENEAFRTLLKAACARSRESCIGLVTATHAENSGVRTTTRTTRSQMKIS
jgi:hypothetical protein